MTNQPQKDIIQLLPDSVANQIAAGEVIQRPASVVKELVENAIDAGATVVDIVIKDAGKTLIQVVDNGCGMSSTDARMAFERHATSKIRKADDLFTLHTMGFRGEALPSIAAVSEIDIRTMRPDDQLGTRLIIKASKVESQEPYAGISGTSISVKNLFYNFVARRRFLKKDTVELGHIMREFERLALVNTGVEMSLTHNGTLVHKLPPGPLKQRVGALFGKTVESGLIPVETRTGLVTVDGFVGLPSTARQRNALQYFFVNGRNMRHPYFHKAILNCYKELISGEAQPNYFVNFSVDPGRIDVNVHPQKHEIKFEDEQMIWQVLTAAVKESLGKYNVGPAIDFEATDVPDIPPLRQQGGENVEIPDSGYDSTYNPFELKAPEEPPRSGSLFGDYAGMNVRRERGSALNNGNWTKLYDSFMSSGSSVDAPLTVSQPLAEMPFDRQPLTDASDRVIPDNDADSDVMSDVQPMFQLRNRWIITGTRRGLVIVDQHRAHVRVLFDRLLPKVQATDMSQQKLIFAEDIELDAATHAVLSSILPELLKMGFGLEQAEGTNWRITGMPADLAAADPKTTVLTILADLSETGADPGEGLKSRLTLAMAKSAAVRNNQPLSADEMTALVSGLFKCPSPNYTPDGYLTYRLITPEELSGYFHK